MQVMISIVALVLVTLSTLVSSKSIPSSSESSTQQDNQSRSQDFILLEVPVPDGVEGNKLAMDGDFFLVDGKNFTNVEELGNILHEERRGKSMGKGESSEPFSLVVPVARNFSSFKELFEILREDRGRPQKVVTGKEQTYVKGTENEDPGLMIFFTS